MLEARFDGERPAESFSLQTPAVGAAPVLRVVGWQVLGLVYGVSELVRQVHLAGHGS